MSPRMSFARVASVEDTRTSTLVVAASNSLDLTKADIAYRCTGANDDVEINAALTAAAAVDGSVELLEGDYNTVLTLSVAARVTLKAVGWGAVINFNAGGHAITIAGNNVKLRDFKVVIVAGAGVAATRPNCIYAINRNRLDITGVWLIGDVTVDDEGDWTLQNAILLDTVTDSRVSESRIDDHFMSGVQLTVSDQNELIENTVTSCGFGLVLDVADYNVLDCNVLQDCYYGIAVYPGSDNNGLTGNVCRLAGSTGILLWSANWTTITGNTIFESYDYGIWLYDEGTDYNTITGNSIQGNTVSWSLIYLRSSNGIGPANNTINGNTVQGSDGYGIELVQSSYNTITGNNCLLNWGDSINLDTSNYCTVTGNTCGGNKGLAGQGCIALDTSFYCTITGNTCMDSGHSGVSLTDSGDCTITGNLCLENTYAGIRLSSSSNNAMAGNLCKGNSYDGFTLYDSSGNTLTGNTCYQNVRNGIYLATASDDNIVVGNTCNENDVNNTGTYNGIEVNASDDNLVMFNTCDDNDLYGIRIRPATSDRNWVKNNQLRGNTSGPFSDEATDTKLATKIFQFTEAFGGDAAWKTTSPTGIQIDAAAEGALALGDAPLEVQMAVRFRVKGVALEATGVGKGMLLEININAGKPAGHEAYNIEVIAVASVISTEDNVALNDAIEWIIDASDDVDVDDIAFGETMEMFALFEDTGANNDIATNAVIRTISMEYV